LTLRLHNNGITNHQLVAWRFEQLDLDNRHRRKIFVRNFDDLDVDRHEIKLVLVWLANRMLDADCVA